MTILIDSGASYNYIQSGLDIGESVPLNKVYMPKTLHGYSTVKSKKIINLFGYDLIFFEIDELKDFNMILGEQGLREIKARIDIFEYKISFSKPCLTHKINYTNDCLKYQNEISNLMNKNERISETLPFATTIQATIRTTTNEPTYTRQYPYPFADKEFVDKEIAKLLNNGVIEKSYSPYNAPIWVVPKKGVDKNGKPKRRLVIDFKKLNSITTSDKYPIPDITMMIQNLGNAEVFSTVDLESGYHQILIREEDREKTAFSINHSKFHFIRMPFGLKNAPSIFQRCVNDILHDYIGIFAYVYIDDVLIFSNSIEEHMQHIKLIFQALHNASMKISEEKSHFFRKEIEFLGHIIKHKKISVDPAKIATIRDYVLPKTLKQLRSFLGLASYYRKFIKDFAKITKPLTLHLKGENGLVKANKSSRILINLDQEAINAFNKIKLLLQEQVELYQPDFEKPFDLTTDASNVAIGAVLSQNRHPITFISRTLSQTEQNYAANEKELLAIVWSLQKLRNYLYGVTNLTIFTDHQPLTFSMSEKNPNTKMKRWMNFIAEYGAEIKYKPGQQNVVADALSRQYEPQSNAVINNTTMHSMKSSPVEPIKRVPYMLNRYKNQFDITKSDHNSLLSKTIFSKFQKHKIKYTTIADLITYMRTTISDKHVNAIYCTEETFYHIKKPISDTFPNTKFVFTSLKTTNVTSNDEQSRIIMSVHNRAHRHAKNNCIDAEKTYYWPTMKIDFSKFVKNCEICNTQKYERRPIHQQIGNTPTPSAMGESISMDLFYIDNNQYITSIDRYSKYLKLHQIESKVNFTPKLEEILTQDYPNCKFLITDNEAVLVSNASKMIYKKYNIIHVTTPIQHSTSNGTVERVHSTLIEITRCLSKQNNSTASDEIFNAVKEYNNTVHSVTKEKPIDVIKNPNGYPKITERILENQKRNLSYHNKNRFNRFFKQDEVIFVKSNRRRKDAPAYAKQVVKEDLGNSVLTTKGKIVHKDDLRRNVIKT